MIAFWMVVVILVIDIAVILWCARAGASDYELGRLYDGRRARRNLVTGVVQYRVWLHPVNDWWEDEIKELWAGFVSDPR